MEAQGGDTGLRSEPAKGRPSLWRRPVGHVGDTPLHASTPGHPRGLREGVPGKSGVLLPGSLCGFSAGYVHVPVLQMATLTLRRTWTSPGWCLVVMPPGHVTGRGQGASEMSLGAR